MLFNLALCRGGVKIARVRDGTRDTYALVKDGMAATREDIVYETGIPLPESVKEFMFDGWLDEAAPKAGNLKYGRKMSEFKMLHPIPNPPKIICLAFNYTDHAREQNLSPPEDPALVIKPRTALSGSGADILYPEFVSKLDYEIEMAVVMGKTARDIPQDEALDAVFGYMVFNDVSARDIQAADKQFTRAKGFDTFAPCGPWITTRDEVPDPHDLRMITRVNGEVRQDSTTCNMHIKIPEIISKISRCMTIERGDIISTGTPAGAMLNKPGAVFLSDGDRIEMEIEGLGSICNTVRARPHSGDQP